MTSVTQGTWARGRKSQSGCSMELGAGTSPRPVVVATPPRQGCPPTRARVWGALRARATRLFTNVGTASVGVEPSTAQTIQIARVSEALALSPPALPVPGQPTSPTIAPSWLEGSSSRSRRGRFCRSTCSTWWFRKAPSMPRTMLLKTSTLKHPVPPLGRDGPCLSPWTLWRCP